MLRVEAASSNHSTAFFSKAEKNVSRIMKQQSRAQGGSQWTTATFIPANRTVTERPNHTGTHVLLCGHRFQTLNSIKFPMASPW